MLNEYERKKFDTIEKVISKEITTKEAIDILGLTERQIYRLKNIYREQGESGFAHQSRGKENPNKINRTLILELEDLYIKKYYDFNFEHFYEKAVLGKYDISYSFVLKQFTNDDIISPLANKKTIKAYEEKNKMQLVMTLIELMSKK